MTKPQGSFKLILAGNTNVPGMINAIIRATIQARDDVGNGSLCFSQIYIFHTEQSLQSLMSSSLDWKGALEHYDIPFTSIVHHVTKIEDPSDERFEDLVKQLRNIVNPLDESQYYVDLTGGISALKTILAVFAYVLDIEHIYSLEVKFSNDFETRRRQMSLFYRELEKEDDVAIEYRRFPPIREFDTFGRTNYTEVIRHRRIIDELTNTMSRLLPNHVNIDYLRVSLLSGTDARLIGDTKGESDRYRQSVFSFSAAIEETANALLIYLANSQIENKTLGQKLSDLRDILSEEPRYFVNAEILQHLTRLIAEIRNSVVHPRPGSDRSLEAIQSYLASQLALTFLRFTTKAIGAFVDNAGQLVDVQIIDQDSSDNKAVYYFGFDGDATGDYMESAFTDPDQSEAMVVKRSQIVREAIKILRKTICKETKDHDSVIFAEGDNILFKARMNYTLLLKLQSIYRKRTGLHSSIGYGQTLNEATIALRLAKAQKGDSIVGAEVRNAGRQNPMGK